MKRWIPAVMIAITALIATGRPVGAEHSITATGTVFELDVRPTPASGGRAAAVEVTLYTCDRNFTIQTGNNQGVLVVACEPAPGERRTTTYHVEWQPSEATRADRVDGRSRWTLRVGTSTVVRPVAVPADWRTTDTARDGAHPGFTPVAERESGSFCPVVETSVSGAHLRTERSRP